MQAAWEVGVHDLDTATEDAYRNWLTSEPNGELLMLKYIASLSILDYLLTSFDLRSQTGYDRRAQRCQSGSFQR